MLNLSLGLSLGSLATQRRGGWSPLSLGVKLLAWWDAGYGLTLAGNQVTAWVDRKGGHSVTQGVSSSRPTWVADGFGGAPGLTFDGNDDVLSLASVPFPSSASPSEMWAVVQQDGVPADGAVRTIASYGGTTANDRRSIGRFPVTGINRGNILYGGGGANNSITNTVIDLSSRHVFRARPDHVRSRARRHLCGSIPWPVAGSPKLASLLQHIGTGCGRHRRPDGSQQGDCGARGAYGSHEAADRDGS